MANQKLFGVLRRKIGVMVLVGLLFSALSFFALMLTEKRYQTHMDFLVVQTSTENQDFYSLFKSSEYLSKLLSEAIYSERFINAVVETGKVNSEFLPFDKKQRLDKWGSMVSVRKNLELGVIGVTIKGDRERDIARIMEGVSEVFTQKNSLFRAGDEKSVEIRILSGPILEQSPTIAKIVKVLLAAFASGFLLTAFIVIVRSDVLLEERMREENGNTPELFA